MNISETLNLYKEKGYNGDTAIYKMCQDIVLSRIASSSFKNNVTIKGGIVMMELSKDNRRATVDIDVDFIKYSLEDKLIEKFIGKLSTNELVFKISAPIKKLHHQDYDGKRVYIEITDKYQNSISTKIDIGVHKNFDIKQDELCFDLNLLNEGISLLVNSKEQIFVEKLKSLLKFGITSTRYKDIFDLYFLINKKNFDKNRCLLYIEKLILMDNKLNEKTVFEVNSSVSSILQNKVFKSKLRNSKHNWLNVSIDDAVASILKYIESLELVGVKNGV